MLPLDVQRRARGGGPARFGRDRRAALLSDGTESRTRHRR
jgi:hypothetical protein